MREHINILLRENGKGEDMQKQHVETWERMKKEASKICDKEYLTIEALEEMDVTERPMRLETLEDVIQHVTYHEGQVSAFWKEQHRLNDRAELTTRLCQASVASELKEMRNDIAGIRKLIYIAMGAATVIGSILGLIIEHFGSHPLQ